jgi:acetyl-CoA C-acetyltransferase
MLRDGLNDAFSGLHSGWHTEDLVTKYRATRGSGPLGGALSAMLRQLGRKREIVAIKLAIRKGPAGFDKDEANPPETTI